MKSVQAPSLPLQSKLLWSGVGQTLVTFYPYRKDSEHLEEIVCLNAKSMPGERVFFFYILYNDLLIVSYLLSFPWSIHVSMPLYNPSFHQETSLESYKFKPLIGAFIYMSLLLLHMHLIVDLTGEKSNLFHLGDISLILRMLSCIPGLSFPSVLWHFDQNGIWFLFIISP